MISVKKLLHDFSGKWWRKKLQHSSSCLIFGLNWQSLAMLKCGLTFRAFKTLIMDSGWSINWITLKISLKILEFYGAKYLLKSFLSMMIFSKYIFLWILALSVMLSYIFYEHENLKILYEIMNSLIFLHRLYLLNWPQQKFNTKWDKCNNFFLFKKAIAQILETLQKYKQLTNKSNQQVRRRGDKEKDMSFCLKVQLSIRFLKKNAVKFEQILYSK